MTVSTTLKEGTNNTVAECCLWSQKHSVRENEIVCNQELLRKSRKSMHHKYNFKSHSLTRVLLVSTQGFTHPGMLNQA